MGFKVCAHAGCRELVPSVDRCCDKHRKQRAKQADVGRESAHQRGYTSRWAKARLGYLNNHALCVHCESEGVVKEATVVDHIIPHKKNRKLFWDSGNWQALCKAHHDKKTAAEDGGFGRPLKNQEQWH